MKDLSILYKYPASWIIFLHFSILSMRTIRIGSIMQMLLLLRHLHLGTFFGAMVSVLPAEKSRGHTFCKE